MICHSRRSRGIKTPRNRSLELELARTTRHGQRDRLPSLPNTPLRTIPLRADHGRHASPHVAARGQIPSPKPPQAQAAQKVKTPASIANQARSWKMRTSERLQIIADSHMDFISYPVSTKVNNARNDFTDLLEPLKS